MVEKLLFVVQGIPAVAFAAAAVLQFVSHQPKLACINVCFAIANYLFFYGK